MILEVSKKQILTFAGIISILAFVGVGSYMVYHRAYSNGYDDGYVRGKNDTISQYENKKGDGTNFYSEEVIEGNGVYDRHMIYHSTPDCQAIKDGIKKNTAYTNRELRMRRSTFCSKCMDEKLIDKCQDFLKNDFR